MIWVSMGRSIFNLHMFRGFIFYMDLTGHPQVNPAWHGCVWKKKDHPQNSPSKCKHDHKPGKTHHDLKKPSKMIIKPSKWSVTPFSDLQKRSKKAIIDGRLAPYLGLGGQHADQLARDSLQGIAANRCKRKKDDLRNVISTCFNGKKSDRS